MLLIYLKAYWINIYSFVFWIYTPIITLKRPDPLQIQCYKPGGVTSIQQVDRCASYFSPKGVFLSSKVCKKCHFQAIKVSNLRKIIIFFDQITEILRNFFNNAKYTARNSFSGVLGYIFSKIFRHLSAKGPKFCRNFGLQRVRV